MKPLQRKGLLFAVQFVPLFAVFLWLYTLVYPAYEHAVLGTATSIMQLYDPPTRIAARPVGGWRADVVPRDGSRRQLLLERDEFVAHLFLLSLALLPALLLATPAPLYDRLRMLGWGMALLFFTQALSIVGLVRGTYCLRQHPGTFLCLVLLRLAYTSGQIMGAVLWALLTWRQWFPRTRAEEAAEARPPAA
jgi:hypothetical protein